MTVKAETLLGAFKIYLRDVDSLADIMGGDMPLMGKLRFIERKLSELTALEMRLKSFSHHQEVKQTLGILKAIRSRLEDLRIIAELELEAS